MRLAQHATEATAAPGNHAAVSVRCRRMARNGSGCHGSRRRGCCGAGCGTTWSCPSQRSSSSAAAWRRCCYSGCDLVPGTYMLDAGPQIRGCRLHRQAEAPCAWQHPTQQLVHSSVPDTVRILTV